MFNPLKNLPLNTNSAYVMAETREGCKVYMPVSDRDDKYMLQKTLELKNYLNTLDPPPLAAA